jgi:xanthine dehydrogenase accessory factor
MNAEILQKLLEARAAAQPVALATNLRSGQQLLIHPDRTEGELCLDVDMVAAAVDALKRDESITFKTGAGEVFVQVHNPPPRVIIVGAVHIAEQFARMAALTGYGVHVIDPRRSFAERQVFEGFTVHSDWPDEAMRELKPDMRTAVVTLTHDPKLDDPALIEALRSSAFYIGALGSRKTHAARLQRLAEQGMTAEQLQRIRGPVGLAIGAISPAEIAISIMAEITQTRRGGKA